MINQATDTQNQNRYEKTYSIGERVISEITLTRAKSSMHLRPEGASIRELNIDGYKVLTGPAFEDAVVQPLKIDASHTMLPAGPNEVGPQHGSSRFLDYQIDSSSNERAALSSLDRLRSLGHLKTFTLLPNGLEIIDDVVNLSGEEQGLSLGEHLYFACNETMILGIRFLHNGDGNGVAVDAIDSDGRVVHGSMASLWPALKNGNTTLHAKFNGLQAIDIGNGKVIKISSVAESNAGDKKVDLWIWHKPNTNTICFEPVCGTLKSQDGELHNQEIVVKSGETIKLTTQIRVN